MMKKLIQLLKLIILNTVASFLGLLLCMVLFMGVFLLNGRLYRKLCGRIFKLFFSCLPFVKVVVHNECAMLTKNKNFICISNHRSYLDGILLAGMYEIDPRDSDYSCLFIDSIYQWR